MRLKVGRFGGQTQDEWEDTGKIDIWSSEAKKKLWIGGIVTAILAILVLK